MAGPEKLKQSLYFSEDVLQEIMREANRLDRSLSWTVQQAWRIAREDVRRFPSMDPRVAPKADAPRPPPRAAPAAPARAEAPREPSAQVLEFLRGKFDHA